MPLHPNCVYTLPDKTKMIYKQHILKSNHHSAFDRTSCSQLLQKVVQCSSFPVISGKFFYQSSVRKTFSQVFEKHFRPVFKLSIFNSKKGLYEVNFGDVQCDAVVTSSGH